MIRILSASWPLFLGLGLLMMSNGLQGPLLSVRGKAEGFDPTVMGQIMSCYFIGLVAGSQLTPILLKRVGHVRVFAAWGAVAAASYIMYAAFVSPFAWGLMRACLGFAYSGVYIVTESWLNSLSSNETRGRTISTYISVQTGGVILGQSLLTLGDPMDFVMFAMLSAMASIGLIPILLGSTSATPAFSESKAMSLRELYRASPLGSMGTFLLGFIFSALYGMSAVFAGEAGFTLAQISAFCISMYVGSLAMQYPIGWLSDRMDRRLMIMGCAGSGAILCVVGLRLQGGWFPGLLLLTAILGGLLNSIYALLLSHTNDFLKREEMAAASAGLMKLYGFSAMGGPAMAGWLMRVYGTAAYWLYPCVGLAILAVYALWRSTRRAAPSPRPPAAMAPGVANLSAEALANSIGRREEGR